MKQKLRLFDTSLASSPERGPMPNIPHEIEYSSRVFLGHDCVDKRIRGSVRKQHPREHRPLGAVIVVVMVMMPVMVVVVRMGVIVMVIMVVRMGMIVIVIVVMAVLMIMWPRGRI